MLKHTFCHIPGIGVHTERQLWSSGVQSWDAVLAEQEATSSLSRKRMRTIRNHINRSVVQLEKNNPRFFSDLLPPNQHWRLFPEFQNSIAYIDIETTGIGGPSDYITTIALYDGDSIFYYIQGDNLKDFKKDIKNYDVIVTYNGKCFDVPFIQDYFGIKMTQAHIDLRYVLKSLGYMGGLKGCEKQLGLSRKELEGVDGYFAVLFWDDYKENKNHKALETLLAYNIQDAVTLETLMIMSYNMKLEFTPFEESHTLSIPKSPKVPFKADVKTIERIREQWVPWY